MKFAKLPKGYQIVVENLLSKFFLRDGCVNVVLTKEGKKIGWVELRVRSVYGGKYTLETHSHLNSKYRKKGFGTLLYHRAISWAHRNGHKIRCSGGASFYAERVWNSKVLNSFWDIRSTKLGEHWRKWAVMGKR